MGKRIPRPVIEQVLPVASDGHHGPTVPKDSPDSAFRSPGHNPARELAALSWRRWLELADLPVLPAREPALRKSADVAALLCGDVDVGDLQRHFLAFLLLDESGDALPASEPRTDTPRLRLLVRLWFELSARATTVERRPLDGSVPRGIATGTVLSVRSACRTALRRLRMAGVARRLARQSSKRQECGDAGARSLGTAGTNDGCGVPDSDFRTGVARLSDTLLLSPAAHEPQYHKRMETLHA